MISSGGEIAKFPTGLVYEIGKFHLKPLLMKQFFPLEGLPLFEETYIRPKVFAFGSRRLVGWVAEQRATIFPLSQV